MRSCSSRALADGELDIDEFIEWTTAKAQAKASAKAPSAPPSPPDAPSPPGYPPPSATTEQLVPEVSFYGISPLLDMPRHGSYSSATEISVGKLLDKKLRTCWERVQREGATRPHFRSLPTALFWPNLEVTFFTSFSTGLLQCSSAVLGCTLAGYATTVRTLAIAIGVICIIAVTYGQQALTLSVFMNYHNDACWKPAELPASNDEVDDPLMALLTNVSKGIVPPTSREAGSFEPPDEDTEEPGCTERALHCTFSWRIQDPRKMRHGDAMSSLTTWLNDACGKGKGIYYLFGMIALQLTTAVVLGITFSMQWSQTTTGSKVLLATLICLQLTGAKWSISATANDKIDGAEKCIVYLFEACSTSLMLAASVVGDLSNGGEDLDMLALSLQFSGLSAQLLMVAIFFPMSVTVRVRDSNPWRRRLC